MIRLTVLFLLIFLSGCATYETVQTGSASVGSLQVKTASQWTSINPDFLAPGGPTGVWTKDGTHLNYVLLYDGVEDGQTLFKVQGNETEPYPAFRSVMAESEVSELVADSIKRFAGANEVVVVKLTPTTFAGRQGFAVELAYTGKSELDYRAYASGAVIEEELYLIIFNAPRLHFFDKDIEQVRRIVNSATVTPS